MRAKVADRMPVGVVYTTFHHPESGANIVTTELSDWATNCPEYKVTAVQVGLPVASEPADAETGAASVPRCREPAVTSAVSSEARLAHEIARQFADEPPQEAAARVAAHIRMFWAPPMIGTLVAEADEGSARLDPVVARVAEMLR